jgi:hypothetical protein
MKAPSERRATEVRTSILVLAAIVIVACFALWLYREPFSHMMDRVNVTKASVSGAGATATVEFKEILQSTPIIALAQTAAPKPLEPLPPTKTQELAEKDPVAAVDNAFHGLLMAAATNTKTQWRYRTPNLQPPTQVEAGAIQALLALGSEIAAGRTTVTSDEAKKYVAVAEIFKELLTRKLPP